MLQSQSRAPISVYIDSPGGSPSSAEALLRLLRLPDQDQSAPCDIITAVTTRAASAAADLLSSGDYAAAFPSSTILHHGIRQFERNPLTLESTSLLSDMLRFSNDMYAMQLAQKIENRFTFRYVTVQNDFDELRGGKSAPEMSVLDCFIEIIGKKLSPGAKKVWKKAKDRHGRYLDLINSVLEQSEQISATKGAMEVQATIIKAIVDFEVRTNQGDPAWSFQEGGMGRLVDDFFLLNEYVANNNSDRLKEWCTSFGKWTLPKEQAAEIDAITDKDVRLERLIDTVRPILHPVWSFFVALCHALQEGENELTATDAYWLGLVDEVIGEDLWTIRDLEEFIPEPEVEPDLENEPPENT